MLYRIVGFEVEPHSIAMDSMAITDDHGVKQCALISGETPHVFELKES